MILMGIFLFLTLFSVLVLMSICAVYFKEKKVLFFSPVYLFSLAWTISLLIYQQGEDFLQDRTIYSILAFYLSFCIPGHFLLLRLGASAEIMPVASSTIIRETRHRWLFHFLISCQVIAVATAVLYLYHAVEFAGLGLLAIPGSPFHRGVKKGLDLQGGLEVVLKAQPPPGH